MPVQVGDLVGFYRRKTPGMGIILQKVDNILEHAGVDEGVAFQIAENAQGRTYWEKKSAIQDLCDGQQVHSTSLKLFFQYKMVIISPCIIRKFIVRSNVNLALASVVIHSN